MRFFGLILMLFLLVQCQKKENQAVKPVATPAKTETTSKFKMYQMSEMAALMEQMYADNQNLRKRIIDGDTIGHFPEHFMKIHSAVMTDDSDNDAFFKSHAVDFIKSQQMIYMDPVNAKEHFNAGVDACIYCHQGKCHGPIARIKKLYIE